VKLIHSTGAELTVRDAGPVVFRLRAGVVPIKLNGWFLLGEDEARDVLRGLLETGLYTGGRVRE
jgi:hypothetical protein